MTREVTSGVRSAGESQQPTASPPRQIRAASGSPSHTIWSVNNACSVLEPVPGVGGAPPNGARTERTSTLRDTCFWVAGQGEQTEIALVVAWVDRGEEPPEIGERTSGMGGNRSRWFLGSQASRFLPSSRFARDESVTRSIRNANSGLPAKTRIELSSLELGSRKSHRTTTKIGRMLLVREEDLKKLRFNVSSRAF